MEKATLGFRIYKIWQILKRFAGTFRQAQTLKLERVINQHFQFIYLIYIAHTEKHLPNLSAHIIHHVRKERVKLVGTS